MTTYAIKSVDWMGREHETPLKATSDDVAVKEMHSAVFDLGQGGIRLYLTYYQDSDGQRGYINPTGECASAGKSWS